MKQQYKSCEMIERRREGEKGEEGQELEKERQKEKRERLKREKERKAVILALVIVGIILVVQARCLVTTIANIDQLQHQVRDLHARADRADILIGHPDDDAAGRAREPPGGPSGPPDEPSGPPDEPSGPPRAPSGPTGGPGTLDPRGSRPTGEPDEPGGPGRPGGPGPSIFSKLNALGQMVKKYYDTGKGFADTLQKQLQHPEAVLSFSHNALNQDWQHFPTDLPVDTWLCTVVRDVRSTNSDDSISSTACLAERVNGKYAVSVLALGTHLHTVSVECTVDCMPRAIVAATWDEIETKIATAVPGDANKMKDAMGQFGNVGPSTDI